MSDDKFCDQYEVCGCIHPSDCSKSDQAKEPLDGSHFESVVMLPDFIERMKTGVKHIRQAQDIFSVGPLDYYLIKLVEHSEALLTRFAPIKIGERAIIVKKIKCEGGWLGSEKNLEVGVEGKVTDVDYRDGGFVYTFVPDVQMYRDREGNYKDMTSKSSYCLREKYLHRST